MKRNQRTLLPLGEKGRDEGMSTPSGVFARKQYVRAARVDVARDSQALFPLAQPLASYPLSPYPLSPKGRGE
jgi:hypothetical protein